MINRALFITSVFVSLSCGLSLGKPLLNDKDLEGEKHDVDSQSVIQLSHTIVSLSSVDGYRPQSEKVTITNAGKAELRCELVLEGVDKAAFSLSKFPKSLKSGEAADLTVSFKRNVASDHFLHSAGIRIITGEDKSETVIGLKGIGQKVFEGKNEPPLQTILNALAAPVDAGGNELHLNTKKAKIGSGVEATHFSGVDGVKVKLTPLARYSPAGNAPFGLVEDGKQIELGKLGASTEETPDAHQTLFPPLVGGADFVETDVDKGEFAVYFIGHKQTASTDPESSKKARIPHTARVYPVHHFQGRELKNAFIIGFEEASNGDYQDGVFLIENVKVRR